MRKLKLKIILASLTFVLGGLFFLQVDKKEVFADDTVNAVAETTTEETSGTTITYADVQSEVEACYESLTMYEGASVKIAKTQDENGNNVYDGSGIRFGAPLTGITAEQVANWTEAGVKFGVLIMPKDKLKQEDGTYAELDYDGFNKNESGFDCEGAPVLSGSTYELQGTLLDLKMNHYVRDYIGRAYIATPNDDGKYTYHFAAYYGGDVANNTRSIYYVSQILDEKASTANPNLTEEEIAKIQSDAESTKEFYIDGWANDSYYGVKTYGYYVDVEYVHKDGTTTTESGKSMVAGAKLNTTVTVGAKDSGSSYEVEQSITYNGETYVLDTTDARSRSIVYPSGRTRLVAVYRHKDLDSVLDTLLKNDDATNLYFGNTMNAVTDDNGNVTIQTSGTNGADTFWNDNSQKEVMLTAKFLYDLQEEGVTKITIGQLSCKANSYTGNTQMTHFVLSDYITSTAIAFEDDQKFYNLTIDLSKEIKYGKITITNEDGTTEEKETYYTEDENGNETETSGVVIYAISNNDDNWIGDIFGDGGLIDLNIGKAQWTLSDIKLA